jgi:Ca-activated chloride channel family protein
VPAFNYLSFDFPWLLCLLPLALFRRNSQRQALLPLTGLTSLPRSFRQKLIWLPRFLGAAAIALLILAAAGPHLGATRLTDETRGIAIEIVVDRSSSMSLSDMQDRGHANSRLDVVKEVAKNFLKRRSGDSIGLIAFAAKPQNLSPLVSHREAMLAHALDSLEIAHGMEDSTAIGDAVALAAARLRLTEQSRAISFRNKIIVLLTDGQENDGAKTLAEAGQLAANWNIRIYCVGIRPVSEGQDSDRSMFAALRSLSTATRGLAVMASDAAGVARFFEAIDSLEPNLIPAGSLSGGWNAAPFAMILAFALTCARVLLRETWLRVAP